MNQSDEFFSTYINDIITNLEHFTSVSMLGMIFMSNKIKEGVNDPFFLKFRNYLEKEEKNNFSYVYNLATIRLWGMLEALVDDFVIYLIENEDKIKDEPLIKKLEGPLIEFIKMEPKEQSRYLLENLKKNMKSSLKQGSGRFESLLNCVGHGGAIDEIVNRVLFEHCNIRNVLVHKNGKADAKLLENCPWLNIRLDQDIHINERMFNKYRGAVLWYIMEIMNRANIYNEVSLNELNYIEAQQLLLDSLKSSLE